MAKASSIDGADQHAHTDEQPAPEQEQDTLGPLENSEEPENGGPSAVELPPGISNTGFSQPPEPHEQDASNVGPDGDLALQAEEVVAAKDQLGELTDVMKQVLDVLQDSTIASKSGKDHRSRFWGVYKRVAEEHDGEFLERYTSDMDIVLVFSGLFSAVSTSFIVAMESNLSPNPSDTTNVLLKQLVQIGLGNFTEAGSTTVEPAWSLTAQTLWIQTIAYASLSMSLLAAFGAVLGKQWLGYYKSNRYGRGSQEERGKRRQEKFDGLVTWYFDAVVQSFPVLLQISLLLFGIALGTNMWYEQPSIAWVIIATTVFGFLFYSLTVMACLISPACPFQTPISTVLRMLRIDRVLRIIIEPASRCFQLLAKSVHGVLQRLLAAYRSSWARLSEALAGAVRATGTFARRSLQLLSVALHKGLHSLVPRSSAKVVDSEAQPLDWNLEILAEKGCTLGLPDIPTSDLEAPSIKWLLETSTDPEVFLAAARVVPQVEWPLDLDISDILHQLYDIFTSCLDSRQQIIPSLEEKASACTMALIHLYHGRVLQAYPDSGEFLCRGRRDYSTFLHLSLCLRGTRTADYMMLDTTINLCLSEDRSSYWFLDSCPASVLEWLSHSLPYHFLTRRVNEDGEKLATAVISKLLSSPSSPSNQIIANCTLLTCVMVGAQVDKKDIVRIDKSSALPQLKESLLVQFGKALWACNGDEPDGDSTEVARRAWKLLDIICRILELAGRHYYNASFHTMRNLVACKKIYLRARSSEQNDPSVSLTALRKALGFTFAAANLSRDPERLWDARLFSQGDSYSPEDFDWLVDYLDFIYSDDHEAAYDILLLLSCKGVRCSPAKQHLFIDRLVACMDSNMPLHLRHAALRATHSAREEIASINDIDDALRDMVLTKLSPAILSVVCPHPGTTPGGDGPDNSSSYSRDNSSSYSRDLCYLELVCALARNSDWHLQLSGDHHLDRCISMIPEYCITTYDDEHTFYIAGILLQIAPEQTSDTSLDSITEQQWWDVVRSAWGYIPYDIHNARGFELLLVLVDGTKKYMHITSKTDLEQLIGNVDRTLDTLEQEVQAKRRWQEMGLEMGSEMENLEQGEGVTIAVKELRTAASNMLESFGQQLLDPR